MLITINLDNPLSLTIKRDMVLIAKENGICQTGKFVATKIEIGGFSQTNLMFIDGNGHKIESGYFMDAYKVGK